MKKITPHIYKKVNKIYLHNNKVYETYLDFFGFSLTLSGVLTNLEAFSSSGSNLINCFLKDKN